MTTTLNHHLQARPRTAPNAGTEAHSGTAPSPHPVSSTIAVIGTGYVGLTTGACLAHLGHTVTCADVDEAKIDQLRRGEMPVLEPQLAEIVAASVERGLLSFVVGGAGAVDDTDVVYLCVPTPQDADGSADLTHIKAAAAEIGPHLRSGAVVVNKSTVPVGTAHLVRDIIGRDDITVVSNPEFLREGKAIDDFLNPDRVVIGCDDGATAERIAHLYASVDTKIILTDTIAAETIKYAANSFLAMKISFINEIATMCEQFGADVADIVDGLGADHRIGSAFLHPGPGWGGSCFPKDTQALRHMARQHGHEPALLNAVIEVNDDQRQRMVDKILAAAGRGADSLDGRPLRGVRVGALGLTFKAGTSDLRDSPSLAIIERLLDLGAEVVAYDPTTSGRLTDHQQEQLQGITVARHIMAAVTDVDVLVILTEWPEFYALDLHAVIEAMGGRAIVDTRNVLDPAACESLGIRYTSVGRP